MDRFVYRRHQFECDLLLLKAWVSSKSFFCALFSRLGLPFSIEWRSIRCNPRTWANPPCDLLPIWPISLRIVIFCYFFAVLRPSEPCVHVASRSGPNFASFLCDPQLSSFGYQGHMLSAPKSVVWCLEVEYWLRSAHLKVALFLYFGQNERDGRIGVKNCKKKWCRNVGASGLTREN